jgi:hypothetical protein
MNNIIINNTNENLDIYISSIDNLNQVISINNEYIYSVGINSNINIPISFNNSEIYIYMSINNKDSWVIINDKIIDYNFNKYNIQVSGDKNFGYKFIIDNNKEKNINIIILIFVIIIFILMIISIFIYFI